MTEATDPAPWALAADRNEGILMTDSGNTTTPDDGPPLLPSGPDPLWRRLARALGSFEFLALSRPVAGEPPTWSAAPRSSGLSWMARLIEHGGKAGLQEDPERVAGVARPPEPAAG